MIEMPNANMRYRATTKQGSELVAVAIEEHFD